MKPVSFTRVRDEPAEVPSETSGGPASPQVRRHRACQVERPLYDPGAKIEYRSEF